MIVLVLVVLAGLLLIGVAIDEFRRAVDRRVQDGYDRANHDRLMREIRRQP